MHMACHKYIRSLNNNYTVKKKKGCSSTPFGATATLAVVRLTVAATYKLHLAVATWLMWGGKMFWAGECGASK